MYRHLNASPAASLKDDGLEQASQGVKKAAAMLVLRLEAHPIIETRLLQEIQERKWLYLY